MKFAVFLLAACLSAQAFAQASTEVVTPGATVTTPPGSSVTTIVQTPDATMTTKVTSTGGNLPQSQIYKERDGKKLEVDSDQSAYIVFDDGARVTAPDGIHTLLGGATVTVKNGKRIP